MKTISLALAAGAALLSVSLGCSSAASTDGTGGASSASSSSKAASSSASSSSGGGQGGGGPVFTVLIQGALKGDEATSKQLHEMVVGVAKPQAQAAGDVGHATFLAKDVMPMAPLNFLSIDRWNSLEGLNQFFSAPTFKDFANQFYAAQPDVSAWIPEQGWTTWGGDEDAKAKGSYAITLRGHHSGDEATALATHNAIVGSVPAPGPVGLGNVAHHVFANPKDATEILIVEVWVNQTAQEMIYGDPNFQSEIAKLWSAKPTIARWNETDWTSW